MASAPSRPQRAPVMSRRSPRRWRQAPSMTPVAMGQPAARGLVVAQVLVLAGQVADAGVGAGPLGAGEAGGGGFGGDLGRGPGAVPGQYRERLDRDPVFGCGVAGRVQGPRGLPQVLKDVDEVDHDVDGGVAPLGFGAYQVELVLGAVNQDDPGALVGRVAGLGLVEGG